MRRKDKQITDKKRKLDEITGLFFQFSGTYAGVRVGQKFSKKNIIFIILDRRLIWNSNLN